MNTHSHHAVNQTQYQDKFTAYATSAVHAQGAEFDKMRALAQREQIRHVLDLGCGGGHVSYHLADVVESVVAYDLSDKMVHHVVATAKQKGLTNIVGQVGSAEQMPFAHGVFDMVISRYSAHHWHSVTSAMDEIYRVLTPKGRVVMVDVLGMDNPVLNNFLQTIETIRDPSHVCDYSLAQWLSLAERAQFVVTCVEKQRLSLNFDEWVARMQTPSVCQEVIRLLQHQASDMVKTYFNIQADGSFESDVMYLQLVKSLC